jgi:hypothetical protein
MRVIIVTCAGLVALSTILVQAAPLPPSKAVPTELTISLLCQQQTYAGTGIGAPNGRISGTAGIGAIAFRRRTGIYLAKTWQTRCACYIIPQIC